MPYRYRIIDRRDNPLYKPGYQLIFDRGLDVSILPEIYYDYDRAVNAAKEMLNNGAPTHFIKIMEEKIITTVERL